MLKSALPFLLFVYASAAPAAETTLPPKLAQKLDKSIAACGFQLFATGAASDLAGNANFASEVGKKVKNQISSMSSANGAGFVTAASTMMVGASMANDGLGAGIAVSAAGIGSLGSVFLADEFITKKEKGPWSFDQRKMEKLAGERAKSAAQLIGLDAVREDALRSGLLRMASLRAHSQDATPISMFDVLRQTQYGGKSLLNERQSNALNEIESRSKNAAPNTSLKDEQGKVDFLVLCREAVAAKLPSLPERDRSGAARAAIDSESFLADLRSYQAANPDQKPLLKKATKAAAPGAPADTSMSVGE